MEPDTSLGLIWKYFEALQPKGEGALSADSYRDAACTAAWAVMEREWSPRYIDRGELRKALAAAALIAPFRSVSGDISSDDTLGQLEQSGLLAGPPDESKQLSNLSIGFRYDVVAEYLAAYHIRDRPGIVAMAEMHGEHGSDFARVLAEVKRAMRS